MTRRPMSVAERICYLHDSGKHFDVQFILHNNGCTEKVKGHKALFASCSDAFEAMLYGPMSKGDTVEMNEVELQAFKTLKKFVYTDVVTFESVAHAQNVFKLADMYDLVHLSRLAEEYISANLSSSTALRILSFTQTYEKLEMQEHCLQVIREDTAAILNSEDFLSCDVNFVDLIVSENRLNIKEVDLFNCVEKWTEKNMNNEDDPSANEVDLLNEIINKIRFLSMTAEDFGKGPIQSSLLTKEESFHLLANIVAPGSFPLPDRFSKERTQRNCEHFADSNDFTSSESGYKTQIRWTMRNTSSLQLCNMYRSPQFNINGIPFTIHFHLYMSQDGKWINVGLRCNKEEINCKLDYTLKILRQERDPWTNKYSGRFEEGIREMGLLDQDWKDFIVFLVCDDDSLTMEIDFEFTQL